MRCVLVLALLFSFGGVPLWAAAPEKKLAATAQIERLIEQLGAKDFRQREAASKALTALGTDALPALRRGDWSVFRHLDSPREGISLLAG